MVHKKRRLFESQALSCMAWALMLGCSEQGSVQEDAFREQQQAVEQAADAPQVSAGDAVEAPQVAPAPSVGALLQAANAESNTAEQDYQAALSKARTDGSARQLREEFEATAEGEFSKRQMMALMLGDIGGDEEIPLLLSLSMEESGLPARRDVRPKVEGEEHEIYDSGSAYVERSVLRRAAVSSLDRIARRGSAAAEEALGKVIADAADPEIAQSAAFGLSTRGLLGKAHKAKLKKRGIPHGFRKLDTEKLMQLSADVSLASTQNLPLPPQTMPIGK
jgi:hypothetical protein